MDDYHAFTSTTGGGSDGGGSSGCLPWVLVVIAIVYLFSKCAA